MKDPIPEGFNAEAEKTKYERSSSPDSFTDESFTASGTLTPTDTQSDGPLLFDTDCPYEKQRGQSTDEAFNFEHFRDHSPMHRDETQCSLLPRRLAIWTIQGSNIKLSALAAAVLINAKIIKAENLEVIDTDVGPSDPISGIFAATHSTVGGVVMGLVDYPVEIKKMVQEDRDVPKTLPEVCSLGSGKGVSRIIGSGLKAPMEFTMNISRGFGNVPKLYGDDTVRKDEKVAGINSGLQAAAKGLGFGLYDGVTGLFTQPVKGAQHGGVGGFFAGLGKGIGGAICKPAAGAVGVPAYAFKGIYEGVQSMWGESTEDQLRKKQIDQGQEEWGICTEAERAAILGKWYEL